MEKISALIMAGKNDSRMKSKKTQFSQTIYGKEVIKRVVETVKKAGIEDVAVIVGPDTKQEIQDILKDEVLYIYQEKCLGSGHAIMQATDYLESKEGKVLIVNGNVPLVKPDTIKKLTKRAEKENNVATILTALTEKPEGYGRIIRNGNKILLIPITMTDEEYNQMVEEAKADEEQWNAIWNDDTNNPLIMTINAFKMQSEPLPDALVCNGAIVFAVVFGVFELALIVFAVLSVVFYIKGKKGQSQTQQESAQDVEIGA